MLVISRKREQAVMAGNVEVRVLGIYGSVVKLGFTAPPDVKILREELVRTIDAEAPVKAK